MTENPIHPSSVADQLRIAAQNKQLRRIGIEVERIGIWPDGRPFCYNEKRWGQEDTLRPGAKELLSQVKKNHGCELVLSPQGLPIGAKGQNCSVTLEPGSQLELSTDAALDLHELVQKTCEFEKNIDAITSNWGLKWMGLGVNPSASVEEVDLIPSPRYAIMTDYLGKKDSLGTSMMRLSSSVQANLDYFNEKEGMDMLKSALAIAPVSYALFGNSPFYAGKLSSYLSYRKHIWDHTDTDRTGLLHEVFEDNFNFDSYVDLAWKRPLMFVQDVKGQFRPSQGKNLYQIAAHAISDVEVNSYNALTPLNQLFPEARLKPGYVEVRSIDGHAPTVRFAAVAFWMGVLYSAEARDYALETLGQLSAKEKDLLLEQSALHGLEKGAFKIDLYSIAKRLLEFSRSTLKDRKAGEERFLEPIDLILEKRQNPAQELKSLFLNNWDQSFEKVIQYASEKCTRGLNKMRDC